MYRIYLPSRCCVVMWRPYVSRRIYLPADVGMHMPSWSSTHLNHPWTHPTTGHMGQPGVRLRALQLAQGLLAGLGTPPSGDAPPQGAPRPDGHRASAGMQWKEGMTGWVDE